tara:strand:- start:280 stop:438 length:159 start_codon:yes stop_codon:yes gene_type:complete
MFHKSVKSLERKAESSKTFRGSVEYCKVSKASKEIMLDRFYNGKRIEFPFAP